MFIDTHAHLSYPDFYEPNCSEINRVIERAQAAGVPTIIAIGTDLEADRQTLKLTQQFDGVYAAVGLHPDTIPLVSLCDMKELAQLATEPKVVAIGETGLDYYREAKDD